MSWRQSSFHMERALLERCPNTLFRRRLSGSLKVPRMVPDLALPSCGFRPITTTIASPVPKPTTPAPSYTSLAEIIPSESASPEESASSPRTPMRNRLVEKAARAYLLPSDSFNKSRLSSPGQLSSSSSSSSGDRSAAPWTQSFSRFLPRLSVLTMSLNPFNAFNSAFQVFRFYVTGATSFQPLVSRTVSRNVSRSFSMPLQRTSYAHADLSIR